MRYQKTKSISDVAIGVPHDWHEKIYLLTKVQVACVTGYKVKTIEELVRLGDFPAPTRLAKNRAPRWNSRDIAVAMGVQS